MSHPRDAQTGLGELEHDGPEPQHQQQIRHARVGDRMEDPPEDAHLVEPDGHLLAGCRPRHEGPGARVGQHGSSVELDHEVRDRGRQQLHHPALLGLRRRDGGAPLHGVLGELGIAAPLLGQAPEIGRRVVDDLLLHVAPAEVDGVCRSNVRPGRHGGDVRGVDEEHTGRCGPGALRAYPHDHRDRRTEDLLNHVAHGHVEPAGGVDLNDHHLGAILIGPLDDL
jgi:hypothetical protein